jgi:UDP-N-acetylmuramate--alanine ligase
LGLSGEKIIHALQNYKGVKRRFEYHMQGGGPVYIDDYAHHPRELEALISSARELFPNSKMMVIFQPHLFSRTRDFADGFANALDQSDQVILLPVYPARELPIEGISSATIFDKMIKAEKQILTKQEALSYVASVQPKNKILLITAGAGDIDELVEPLTEILKTK